MCTTCHGVHGAQHKGNLLYELPQPCITCHPDILENRPKLHTAVTEFGCSGCHDPHWAPKDKQLHEGRHGTICFRCHQDDSTHREVVHKPIADRTCTLCHDPHGSAWPANLRSDPTTVCLSCHPEQGAPLETPHAALEMSCTATCHDPHASDNTARLRLSVVQTCTGCHVGYDDGVHVIRGVTGNGHPIGTKPHPLQADRMVDCASCHNPHGSDKPSMWRFADQRMQLCVECHGSLPGSPSEAFVDYVGQLRDQGVDIKWLERWLPPETSSMEKKNE